MRGRLGVHMVDGEMSNDDKTSSDYVWPVRSGQAALADIPKSGQITSYGTGTIDDGGLQRGVAWPDPRFSVASSGTGTVVTDNLTGLMWASNPTLSSLCSAVTQTTWQGALDYVACLNTNNYLSHNGWRLPNVNELESLVHAEYTNTALCSGSGCSDNAAWLNTQGFSNVQAADYWSSTTYAGSTGYAWYVNMFEGDVVGYDDKSSSYYVWPVRSGQ